jgi:hypothetical protein
MIPEGMARDEATGELFRFDPMTGGTGPSSDFLIGGGPGQTQTAKTVCPAAWNEIITPSV